MEILFRCVCGKVLQQKVSIGYKTRAVLGAAGWEYSAGRYYCPDCKMSLGDYARMLGN